MRAQSEPRNSNATPESVDVIPRAEFIREFGRSYEPGQHVTMLGPTQRGKTTLCHELLGGIINPDHKAVILAGKPPKRDAVMGRAADKLNLSIVPEWPPTPYERFRNRNRNGYVLRPRQTLTDLERDEANLKTQFSGAMRANYASDVPVITVVDETHHVYHDLGLKKQYEAPLMRGAPVNAEWSLIQRGRYISYHAYAAPDHLFIFFDPDIDNRKRYSEIGGVDPRVILALTSQLQLKETKGGRTISEALYIRRAGPNLAIVKMS